MFDDEDEINDSDSLLPDEPDLEGLDLGEDELDSVPPGEVVDLDDGGDESDTE